MENNAHNVLYIYLVGGLEHLDYFSHHIGNDHPQLTNSIIFQRGRLNHQPVFCLFSYGINRHQPGDVACCFAVLFVSGVLSKPKINNL